MPLLGYPNTQADTNERFTVVASNETESPIYAYQNLLSIALHSLFIGAILTRGNRLSIRYRYDPIPDGSGLVNHCVHVCLCIVG